MFNGKKIKNLEQEIEKLWVALAKNEKLLKEPRCFWKAEKIKSIKLKNATPLVEKKKKKV